MKKFIKTLAATLATVLVFGMTVSAAGSPSTPTNDTVNHDNAEKTQKTAQSGRTKGIKDGKSFKLNLVALDAQAQSRLQEWCTANGYGSIVECFDMSTSEKDFAAEFMVAGIAADSKLALVHELADGSKEVYGLQGNGENVWATTSNIKSASPFAIVYGTASAATAVVAPKTGEVIALAAILAIVMMTGAVVCARKARYQK